MIRRERKINCAFLIVCICLMTVLSLYIMSKDVYWNGDEVVTYGMANSYHQGWMLSKGRVVSYLEENVIGDSVSETIGGLKVFVWDIVQNKKQASYFTYPRPSETGWYSKEQVRDWFCITEGEGFNYASVYLNAMGDDANSFLYYMLVHIAGSFFPAISGTSWAGYLVNLLASIVTLILLWKICDNLKLSQVEKVMACCFYAVSLDFYELVTLSRAYAVSTMMHMLLILLHICLMKAICEKDEKREKRNFLLLILIYVVGYVTHYAIMFFAGFLGIAMTVWYICGKHKHLNRYLGAGVLAIVLGMIADPVSVVGLLMKLGDASEKSSGVWGGISGSVLQLLVPNKALLYFLIAILIFSCGYLLFYYFKNRGKGEKENISLVTECKLVLVTAIVVEMICVQLVTKQDYYKAIYPMIIVLGVDIIYQAFKRLLSHRSDNIKKKCVLFFIAILVCSFATLNFLHVIGNKKAENVTISALRETLDENVTEEAILLRGHASGYDLFPELKRYENTLVITGIENEFSFDEQSLKECHRPLTLITSVGDDNVEVFLNDMKELGYRGELLYDQDGIEVFCMN